MPPVSSPASLADYVSPSKHTCPQCGQPLDRMRRRMIDHITSLLVPVQRYRCRGFICRWEGNLKVKPEDAQATLRP